MFSATWCGPCQAFSAVVEQVGRYFVGKPDVDQSPSTFQKYGDEAMPACIVFQDGRKTGSQTGLTNYGVLVNLLGF